MNTHHVALVAYARTFVRDQDRAAELTQEAFLRLVSNKDGCTPASVRAWLYLVCRNLCIDELRATRRLKLVAETPPVAESREAVEARELWPDMQGALRALPERQREIVQLRFVHGLRYREIADVMDLTETNVGYLLHVALKRMRAILESPAVGVRSS